MFLVSIVLCLILQKNQWFPSLFVACLKLLQHSYWKDTNVASVLDGLTYSVQDVHLTNNTKKTCRLFFIADFRNEGLMPYGNIMYDRRIIRGNTYAQHTLPVVSFYPSAVKN